MSENRFLQSCSALLASAILVCGTHLLLIASQPSLKPQHSEVELPVSQPSLAPTSETSIEITTENAPEVPLDPQAAPEPAAPGPLPPSASREITASLPQSSPTPSPFAGDQTSLGSDDAAPAVTPTLEAAPVETAFAEIASAAPQTPDNASVPEQHAVAEIAEEPQHAVGPPVEEQHASTELTDVASHAPAAEQAVASAETVAAPASELSDVASHAPAVEQAVASAGTVPAPTSEPSDIDPRARVAGQPVSSAETSAAPTSEPIRPTDLGEPATTAGTNDNASAAIVAAAEVAASSLPSQEAKSPSLTAGVANAMPRAIASAAAIAAAQPAPKPKAAVASRSAKPESVPLPRPRPIPAADTKKAPPPKPETTALQRKEQPSAETKPRWSPMALAPADKDTVAKPKLSPKRTESAGGYNAKIWSALARRKPKTGKSGSASVTFAIGPGGRLQSVRISGSSGDSQLDQMALATVRNAAPFPPPNSSSASYTIRIYFR